MYVLDETQIKNYILNNEQERKR